MNEHSNIQFPEKIYLSGADCFHLMLEMNEKKHEIGNNVIRIIFHFDDIGSITNLLSNIKTSPLTHWICNISLKEGGLFQKPYWHYFNQGKTIQISEHHHRIQHQIPSEILQRKIDLKTQCLFEFDIIHYPDDKIALVFSWHHILMDARGSGMFIRHLNHLETISDKSFNHFFPAKEKYVSPYRYIRNMYIVKRFIRNSTLDSISTTLFDKQLSKKIFTVKSISFSDEETQLIDQHAKLYGAKFGANIFLIACCAHGINDMNKRYGCAETIWVPIPYDGRKRGGNGPIITNCISFLFYKLDQKDLESIESSVKCISQQMNDQIKIEMPKKYNLFLDMMRYIPLKLYHFLVSNSSKGVVASFLYTSAGENFWDTNQLLNIPINDILILPPFTFPPGMTLSFLRHNNKLKMNIVYCEDLFSQNDIDELENSIKKYFFTSK